MVFQSNRIIEFVFSYRLFWVTGNASTELKALLHFWLFWILITSRRKYQIICIVSAKEELSFWWTYGLWPNILNNLGTWMKKKILDARLKQMKPPYEITRTSSPLSDIGQWKASNFRAFALYYFTALEDLLPKVYFDHFLCLIYGIQVLLQEEVTVNLVQEVDFLFQHFVREAEVLYGHQNMRFNFHLITHLARATLNWGCIWSWSTFIPEWFNGVLVSSTNGTQCVPEQMVKNLLMKKALRSDAITLMLKYNLPQNVSVLLKDFLNISHHDLLSSLDIDSSVFNLKVLGVPKKKLASKECQSAIQNYFSSVRELAPLNIKSYYSYKRLLFGKKAIFTTTSYTRSPKRINYCA